MNNSIACRLDRDGFCVVPHRAALKGVAACFHGQLVRYKTTEVQVQRLLMWLRHSKGISLHALKFRASNNNNNTDASQPHRDVMLGHNFAEIYTVLYYLDNADLEVYPGSHRRADVFGAKPKRMQLLAGDMVVFHASLLHRGVYSVCRAQDNRRVLQIFDCVTDKRMHANIYNRLVKQENSKKGFVMKVLSRHVPQLLVMAGIYINVVCNRRLAYTVAGIPSTGMVSFEGNVPRIGRAATDDPQKGNQWYLLDTTASHDIVGHQSTIVSCGEVCTGLAPLIIAAAMVYLAHHIVKNL